MDAKEDMQLRERYSVKALDTMNVVCPLSSDREAMSADDLIKYTSTLLRVCGVLNGTFAELREPKKAVSRKLAANTYRANLVRRCGLEDDPYTVKYLCGESLLGNTSSDNYISFSDDDALLRLYTIMRVLQPVEEYAETMQHDILDKTLSLCNLPAAGKSPTALQQNVWRSTQIPHAGISAEFFNAKNSDFFQSSV